MSTGGRLFAAQVLLVILALIGEIYGGSVWFAVPPLVLAFALTAGRARRSRRSPAPRVKRGPGDR